MRAILTTAVLMAAALVFPAFAADAPTIKHSQRFQSELSQLAENARLIMRFDEEIKFDLSSDGPTIIIEHRRDKAITSRSRMDLADFRIRVGKNKGIYIPDMPWEALVTVTYGLCDEVTGTPTDHVYPYGKDGRYDVIRVYSCSEKTAQNN
jgi:hypothetical protein